MAGHTNGRLSARTPAKPKDSAALLSSGPSAFKRRGETTGDNKGQAD